MRVPTVPVPGPVVRPGDNRASPAVRIRLVTIVVIGACAARAVWLLAGTGFFADDMVNLAFARHSRLDATYLGRNVFGEFEPGLRLVNWMVTRTAPVERWPTVVIEVVAFVVVLGLVAQIIGRLSGPTWWTPVLVGLVGWGIVATATLAWWSSAVTYVVASAFGLFAVRIILDYAVEGGRHRPVGALVATTVCASLYPGAAVFPLVAAVLWALFRPDGPTGVDAFATVARRWRLWVLLALPLAAAFAVTTSGAQYGTGAVAGSRALASYVWMTWSQTFVPSLIGLPPQFVNQQEVGQELIIVLVVVSVVACRGAWRAWLAFALPAGAVILAHGVARLANLGAGIGAIRSDLLPIEVMFALVVPLAFARTGGTFTTVAVRPRGWWERWSAGRRHRVAVGATVVALVACAAVVDMVDVGTPAITEVAQGRMAHDYLAGFTRSWRALDLADPHAVVADTILAYPLSISTVPDAMYPYDTTSIDLGLFVPGVRYATGPGPTGRAYGATVPSGRLRPARPAAGPTVSLIPVTISGEVTTHTVGGLHCTTVGPVPAEVALPVASESLGELLSLGRRVSFQPFLHLGVASTTAGSVTVDGVATVRPGDGWVGLPAAGPVKAVFLSLPAGSTTCLRSASLAFVAT